MKVLFVTYSKLAKKEGKISFIGVLKRCFRLIAHIDRTDIKTHVVNLGVLPLEDPLVKQVMPKIQVHDIDRPDRSMIELFLFSLRVTSGRNRTNYLLDKVQPDLLVLGESPLSGMMRLISLKAFRKGIPQVCIENYYNEYQLAHFEKEYPWIAHWILLGLPLENSYGKIAENAVLVPPLVQPASLAKTDEKVDITILGYDVNVALLGLEVLRKLPENTCGRLIYSSRLQKRISKIKQTAKGLNLTYEGMPSEAKLSGYLANSKIVVCKSGFQQIVECLAQGTPVLIYDAQGGVPPVLLSEHMRPYAEYFPSETDDWSSLLEHANSWLDEKPQMPWVEQVLKIKQPVEYAAKHLEDIYTLVESNIDSEQELQQD